jgi:DNA-binding HxlR family transcriptional regulator
LALPKTTISTMSIELPVLRLGLVGFSTEQQERIAKVLSNPASGGMVWQVGKFSEADAWWVNGARTQSLPDGTLRVASGVPSGRSVQLNLKEVDRPIAFSTPLAARELAPTYRFDLDSDASIHAVLAKFESWLRPLTAQFYLASHIIENESALGSGVYHVIAHNKLLAVVNLQGEVGVLPTGGPGDFEDALWNPRPASAAGVPEGFVRASLSQLMWQYAVRTLRDVLPKRYRSGPLYFRRPPRLPQRLLTDSHLLLLRELAGGPASFEELQQRTGLGDKPLARALAALYLVGSITSNPKRAGPFRVAQRAVEDSDSTHGIQHSLAPSGIDSLPATTRPPVPSDLTAPAPLSLE